LHPRAIKDLPQLPHDLKITGKKCGKNTNIFPHFLPSLYCRVYENSFIGVAVYLFMVRENIGPANVMAGNGNDGAIENGFYQFSIKTL